MKTVEQHFADWESEVFGYGYGTGEEPVLAALKDFLTLCDEGPFQRGYDHEALSRALTPRVAWLLINTLCHADILEYGTSSRHGWLTPQGEALRAFVASRSISELEQAVEFDDEYVYCFPEHCNCMGRREPDCRPENPFWPKRS